MSGCRYRTLAVVLSVLTLFAETATTLVAQATSETALHGPSFAPSSTLRGSALTGSHTAGPARWSLKDREVTADGSGGPGLLVLEHTYQDVGVYASFRCTGNCDAGILLRAQETAEGIKGVLLEVQGQETTAYRVMFDTDGNISRRDKLRLAGGMVRYAPPAREIPPVQRTLPAAPAGITLPIEHNTASVRDGQWNELEILLDADIMRSYLNDDGGRNSVATDDMSSYGSIALYVGKGGQVQFKNLSYKDLAFKTDPIEHVGSRFRKQSLSPFYYGWSAAAADFNKDGKMDVVSGSFIYFGPDYATRREIFASHTFNPSDQYSLKIEHAYDFTGDGWPDVLLTNGEQPGAYLYVNPQGESRRWDCFKVVSSVSSEETLLTDVDGDGKPDLVYVGEGYMRYASPDPTTPTGPWVVHSISEKGPWPPHGIGTGDINGDGRQDIVSAEGWWEQPLSSSGNKAWTYHPVAFGRYGRIAPGGSQIGVYDVNGDGRNDVVTSLEAHGFGLAWFEQKRAANGEITFVEHMVMDNYNTKNEGDVTFSEPHGSTIADVDGDGIPDFIVGKRQWSHNDDFLDPDVYGPALIYWYRTVRDPKAAGGARLLPELIDNSSGAGSDLLAVDLDRDGKVDIVSATKRGLYVFWNKGIAAKSAK